MPPAPSWLTMRYGPSVEPAVRVSGGASISRGRARAGSLHSLARSPGEGSYVIIPGGAHHDYRVHAGADLVLLARRDGPPDFNFVER